MASELTLSFSMAYDDGVSDPESLSIAELFQDVTTKVTARGQQSIGITDTAINLGSVAALGYMVLINRDTTNYVDVKVAAAGTIIARLRPSGGFCIFLVGSGITAPVAIANTAACVIDKLICSL